MASHCLAADHPQPGNDIIFYSNLFNKNTKWENLQMIEASDNTPASCIVSHNSRAHTEPKKTSGDGTFKLTLDAERNGSADVSRQYSKYVSDKADNNVQACGSDKIPAELNFVFCGNIVTDKVSIPMCMGQGSADKWTVASPLMDAVCRAGTSYAFDLHARNESVGACISKIGCDLLGGKVDEMGCT